MEVKLDELKQCPFCHQASIVVSHPGQNWDGKMGKVYEVGGMHGLWYVGCPVAFFEVDMRRCEVMPAASWYAKLEDAVKAWNKRG